MGIVIFIVLLAAIIVYLNKEQVHYYKSNKEIKEHNSIGWIRVEKKKKGWISNFMDHQYFYQFGDSYYKSFILSLDKKEILTLPVYKLSKKYKGEKIINGKVYHQLGDIVVISDIKEEQRFKVNQNYDFEIYGKKSPFVLLSYETNKA